MNNFKTYTLAIITMGCLAMGLTACEQADIASRNVSKAADNFEINRRVVFLNGITDKYILVVEGLCSLGNFDSSGQLSVTCKTGPSSYVKHFLGLSDNVTFFAEQLQSIKASAYHYRVVFRPQTIIPDIDFQGDVDELLNNKNGDG